MNILMIGDIVGKNGRLVVNKLLPSIKKKYNIDFVIANGENATHGKGLIENHYEYLLNSGIDVITLGNHYNSKSEIADYINGAEYLIRPYNLKVDFPGVGTSIYEVNGYLIRVTNLLGCAFMSEEVNSPYESLENIIKNEEHADIHIVDFHAEATGEKLSLGWAFDGKVSAILGTHTHVQTNDLRLLKNGTLYMSDIGMCGPYNGILGSTRENVIKKTWLGVPTIFGVEDNDDEYIFSACSITIDEDTKKIVDFKNIYEVIKESEI